KGMSVKGMSEMRREMFETLFKIFSRYRTRFPKATVEEAAFHAVNSPAPKFFLTPKSVKVILCRFIRERRQYGLA
ncbi:MAG: hypothetical protein K2J70_04620, partial [Muribaculaceae bacterium]|nr:hypothetical protein [Muribaculaceae bacterium]